MTILEKHFKIVSIESSFNSNETRYSLICKKCNTKSTSSFTYARCYTCFPVEYNAEKEVANCFDKKYSLLINQRSILEYKRLQLDVYIPELKTAIEYDGLRFHSHTDQASAEMYKFKHLEKTIQCAEKGIRLYRIFENEWITKKPIWLSMIQNIQGNSTRIYGRECITKVITDKTTVNQFMTNNHLQGPCNFEIAYGLYFKNSLVSVMTFGKSRYNKNYTQELLRFANVLNTTVIGGASKLLSRFQKDHPHDSIITYANRRWSNGNLYNKLGFTQIADSPPNYFYTKGNLLYSRIQFQKHKLSKLLPIYDNSLTEKQNMFNNGYGLIWDCGNLTFVKKA